MLKVKLKLESEVYATLCAVGVMGAFLAFALYIAPLPSYSPQPRGAVAHDQQPQPSKENGGNHGSGAAPVTTGSETPPAANCQSSVCGDCCQKPATPLRWSWDWWFDSPVTVFTLLLVIVGALQAIFLGLAFKASQDASKAAHSAANASLLQARAIVAAESPLVGLVSIQLVKPPDPLMQAFDVPITGGMPPDDSRVLLTLSNAGRTAARLTEICIEWRGAIQLPPEPAYEHKIGTSIIVPPQQVLPLHWRDYPIFLTDEQREAMQNLTIALWVYGFISYRDFLGDVIELGFSAHWEPFGRALGERPRGFVMEGPPAYNYQRKRENKAAT